MNKIEVRWENIEPGNIIYCRLGQILQILLNLINNSVDSLNERFPDYDDRKRIRISVFLQELQGRMFAQFEVEDFGMGVPIEIQNYIFKTFFTTKSSDKGTGLGLSVSLGIAEEHGGTLSFKSIPGENTCFYLNIPLAKTIHESS